MVANFTQIQILISIFRILFIYRLIDILKMSQYLREMHPIPKGTKTIGRCKVLIT